MKRKKQTIFLPVEPNECFEILRKRVAEIAGVDPGAVKLYATDKMRELPDVATIADQEIESDACIYAVHRIEGTSAHPFRSHSSFPIARQPLSDTHRARRQYLLSRAQTGTDNYEEIDVQDLGAGGDGSS